MPIVALPVLWLLPLGEGMAVYAIVALAACTVYRLAVKAMRAPVMSGIETLLQEVGSVRSAEGHRGSVWIASELWSAESRDAPLAIGDAVEVIGIDGLRLIVRKVGAAESAAIRAQLSHS
jgi:membrane-bound ClpP family serine protease